MANVFLYTTLYARSCALSPSSSPPPEVSVGVGNERQRQYLTYTVARNRAPLYFTVQIVGCGYTAYRACLGMWLGIRPSNKKASYSFPFPFPFTQRTHNGSVGTLCVDVRSLILASPRHLDPAHSPLSTILPECSTL
ncbi:hypothetical protein F4824DRAFT_415919 [Ustulina deusta]|nr:hypothetical protein F4824DRAFT_415919 [Ustulina deusta]